MTPLEAFNAATAAEAMDALLACCGSRTWASKLVALRGSPHLGIPSAVTFLQAATEVWFGLPEQDWLEAFACHPRIGEVRSPATQFLTYSTSEQQVAQQTLIEVQDDLRKGNRAYEARFGFLYIVFASGRTAPELLAVLDQRLENTRSEELEEAAIQQDRITRHRLERWFAT